ncbi:MAG: hypothetical protein KatS3mg087_0461 [Patescibacteria group bacterium]|nr:MAG: hypothetical protein KatS3mg087_0461 [Patescibacteria group bacterium]
MHIALEGPDGVGKTTVARILSAKLENAIYIAEPYLTTDEERAVHKSILTQNPDVQAAWFHYLRTKLYYDQIQPAKQNNKHIVQDRCFLSTIVYQYLLHNNVQKANQYLNNLPPYIWPMRIYVLELEPNIVYTRKPSVFEEFDIETYEQIHRLYKSFNTIDFRPTIKHINANRPIDEVANTIFQDITSTQKYEDTFTP